MGHKKIFAAVVDIRRHVTYNNGMTTHTPTPPTSRYVMLTFRTTRTNSDAIDAAAAREGVKRSEFIRRAVAHRLFIDEFADDVPLRPADDTTGADE